MIKQRLKLLYSFLDLLYIYYLQQSIEEKNMDFCKMNSIEKKFYFDLKNPPGRRNRSNKKFKRYSEKQLKEFIEIETEKRPIFMGYFFHYFLVFDHLLNQDSDGSFRDLEESLEDFEIIDRHITLRPENLFGVKRMLTRLILGKWSREKYYGYVCGNDILYHEQAYDSPADYLDKKYKILVVRAFFFGVTTVLLAHLFSFILKFCLQFLGII